MTNCTMSFIIATRDRLPFLKITLERLITELHFDEEIVVIDGHSTDGTQEYLKHLFKEGKIHQFVSEPDKNQAHAWNKAMLMANGTIIKKIIDDDVYSFAAIRTCKNYMLQNPDIDVLISNDLSTALSNYHNINKHSRLPQFEKWISGLIPSFTFGDVHMLIRKSSLAYMGLYNTEFVMLDWEYSLRISHLRANIAYYTGYNALSVTHSQTISSLKNNKLVDEQGKRASRFYNYKGDRGEISFWSETKIFIGKLLYSKQTFNGIDGTQINDIEQIYNYCYQYISDQNSGETFNMITV